MTLSKILIRVVERRIFFATVPSDGPKNVIQYFVMNKSGSNWLILRAVDQYVNGLMESSQRLVGMGSATSFSVTSCVSTGNKKSGYWRVNVTACNVCSCFSSSRYRLALNWAMPTLRSEERRVGKEWRSRWSP